MLQEAKRLACFNQIHLGSGSIPAASEGRALTENRGALSCRGAEERLAWALPQGLRARTPSAGQAGTPSEPGKALARSPLSSSLGVITKSQETRKTKLEESEDLSENQDAQKPLGKLGGQRKEIRRKQTPAFCAQITSSPLSPEGQRERWYGNPVPQERQDGGQAVRLALRGPLSTCIYSRCLDRESVARS